MDRWRLDELKAAISFYGESSGKLTPVRARPQRRPVRRPAQGRCALRPRILPLSPPPTIRVHRNPPPPPPLCCSSSSTPQELFKKAVFRVCGFKLSDNVVRVVFHIFDDNGDGFLSDDEFFTAYERHVHGLEGRRNVDTVGALMACCKECYNNFHDHF